MQIEPDTPIDPKIGMPRVVMSDVIAEGFILLAMAVVTLALGAALYVHFNLDFVAAAVCALSVYLGLLATHALVHRNSAVEALKAELAHLESRFRRGPVKRTDGSEATPQVLGDRGMGTAPVKPVDVREPVAGFSANDGDDGLTDAPLFDTAGAMPPRLPDSFDASAIRSEPFVSETPSAVVPEPAPALSSSGPVVLASQGLRDVAPAPAVSPVPRSAVATTLSVGPAVPVSRPPREADVEMIQGLIKKLADEVNAVDGAASASEDAMPAAGADAEPDAKPRGPVSIASQVIAKQSLEPAASAETPAPVEAPVIAPVSSEGLVGVGEPSGVAPVTGFENDQIDVSVDALRTTADAMRDMESVDLDADVPVGVAADPGVFAIISDALSAGRVDVLLDPILGLENRRANHFEISLRLRDIDNSVIDTGEWCDGPVGSGINTLLDRAALSRTASVAMQLDSRGRNGAVFSRIAGETVAHEAFVDDVYDAFQARSGFASQLVLTLSQAHVRALGVREWSTLSDLRDLGFRFAISGVTDLDLDFEELAEKGFGFAKLDADVFLNGLGCGQIRIPASDICKHLGTMGFAVVVDRIDDDEMLGKVSSFGAVLGQGQLFGGPRTVKAQALKAASGSAAA